MNHFLDTEYCVVYSEIIFALYNHVSTFKNVDHGFWSYERNIFSVHFVK
jgi:hypothetical protein